jgi:glycosyltransferase involved in cell wall biosynthesis
MSRSLQIAICLSHFHPTVGGAERQLLQLARLWAAEGHKVVVITRPVQGAPRRETYDQIEIRRTLHTWSLGPLFGVTFVGSLLLNLLALTNRCHVVLAAQAPWEAVSTGIYRNLTRKPTIVRLANAGPFGDLRQLDQATGRRILRRMLKWNSAFLALSDQSRQELQDLGCHEPCIRRITNGVDVQRFQPPVAADQRRNRTALFVGRLTAQKDPQFLLRSWQQVSPNGEFRLLVAGDGPLAEPLKQQIADQQMSNVELLGARNDLQRLYQEASVFVLPSRSEGCSNALLEAMASGLCPIVTNIGGNRDVVTDGVTGRLVESGHVRQLSDALREVLEDQDSCMRLGTAAREHVIAHHDIHDVANRYLQEFYRLVR